MATRRLQFDDVGKNKCVPEMNKEGVAVEEATRCNIGMQQVDTPCCNFVDSLLVGENQEIQGNGSNERSTNMAEGNRTPQACCQTEGQEGCSITLLTPPATVDPSVIETPDDEHKYSHKEDLDQALIPRVGMCFKTEDEAHKFYCKYAEKAGFQPKKANKTDFTRYIRCNNYGISKYYKGNEAKRVRGKTTKKTSCLAFMKLKFRHDKENSEEFAEITDVRLNHNHVLLPKPTETKQMRAHKYKDPLLLEYVDDLQSNDVPNHSIRNIIRDMHGGEENIAMTDRDLENRKAANMRAEHANDVNKLLEFFKDCEAENPQFHWEAKVDLNGCIHSIFWSHASMQGEYVDFGDAMSFDTTYKTNVYDKPLAMFVGADHHLHNTVFGCALLGDETTETFEWVFRAFKKCMRKNRTRCILTDQDSAMEAAIKKEFPGITHKICRWHVVNKLSANLNELYSMYEKENFKEKFNSVLNHPLTPEEFEAAWKELITEFNLEKNSALQSLYDQRSRYIPAYFKGEYCGRMASTQRSESTNFIMKKCFVGKKTALHRFAKQVLNFVQTRKMKESAETYHGTSKTLTKSKWEFEIQMARIYTRNVFKDFEKKIVDCTAYKIEDNTDAGRNCYLVCHTNKTAKITWGQHKFKVRADKENGDFNCECREWEHTGLFCVHLLRTFIHIQVDKIPVKYIFKRYTKFARNELAFSREDKLLTGADGNTTSYRTKLLLTKSTKVVQAGTMSNAAFQRAIEVMDSLFNEIKDVPHDVGPNSNATGRNTTEQETYRQDDTENGGQRDVWGHRDSAQGSRQTNNAHGTVIDTCHDHVDRAEAEEVEKGRCDGIENGESSVQNTIGAHDVGIAQETGISMDRPPQAKTKGRSKTSSEKNEVTLGAQGEKKGTRRCSVCHLYSTHNSATCPTLEKNQDRLEAKKNKKRGRPPGGKNKKNKSVHGNDRDMQEKRPMEKRRLLEDRSYKQILSNSEDDDEYVDEADLVSNLLSM